VASKRSTIKTGRRVDLERVENSGEIAYFVRGRHPAHRKSFDNLAAATARFDSIEAGHEPVGP
jgi:hypothetical protein